MDATSISAAELLGEFVGSEFPTCIGLLLFGSHATGCARASSDVDSCVLLPRVDSPYQMIREFDGCLLDLHVHDFSTLMQAMQKQRRNRVVHIATWLRVGIILKDEGGFLRRARVAAIEILDGPREPVDWSVHRASISNLVRHVRTSNSEYTKIACLNALYRLTAHLILLRAGRWLQSPTDLADELHDVDAALCARLHQTYHEAILGMPTTFLRLIEKELDSVGGTIRDSEQRFVA
jgi:hypothetical protein